MTPPDAARYLTINDEIDAQLLRARRVLFAEPVGAESATDVIRKLWYLDLQAPGKPILLVINSPGGSVDAGFAVWDQVKMLQSPVTTLVTGLAASMGSILSLCAAKGRRFATPNCRILIHQPSISGQMVGVATDLEIQAREILRTRAQIIELYVEATGQPAEVIQRAIDRDKWFKPQEALEFGLLDRVVTSMKDIDGL